ncbi:MAG TPA: glycoside hydrolase family 3 N-terminal domain-containing protein [Mobilitalea sp.]|nr:glycoside hydrolase family 3 N-terminal domain-containing protein [Mobilitalea sp.]
MIDLKANPFYLNDHDIKWVEETISSMTLEDKIGQLFCPVGYTSDREVLKKLVDRSIAGIMYRKGPADEIRETYQYLQDSARIPLLLPANLEAGGNGIADQGTYYGMNLQVAATDDPEEAYHLGYVSCVEGAAVGCNWAFAPVVDIDMNFRNPITNLRTFGKDAKRVLDMGAAYMRGAKEAGVAVSIKHFPGDGVDERDQHLHTTTNSLSAEDWMNTYGMVYGGLIEKGAQTVMVGHIAQPAWAKKINPELTEEEAHMPATLSPAIIQGLLRDRLHYNGMIVTDASTMLGYTCAMPREKAIPASIAAGIDMILFNKSFEEDYHYMMEGYKKGIITDERLQDAVLRILALKASLKLPEKQKAKTLVPGEEAAELIGCEKHAKWARESADKSITLVKDTQNLLPLSPEKNKRIALYIIEDGKLFGKTIDLREKIKALLTKEGFIVIDPPERQVFSDKPAMVEEFKREYDLVLYVIDLQTASNNTVIRLFWNGAMGGTNSPWFTQEIPTMCISLANPYHLLDVPMMKTYINAYSDSDDTVSAVVDKIVGKSSFKGTNPVDPFCGREDTKF